MHLHNGREALPAERIRACQSHRPPGERVRILADEFLAISTTCYQQRSLGAALALFLDTATKTALHRTELVSKRALSRLLNEYDWNTAQGWFVLQEAQWDALRLAARRKHRPLLRLSVDLTSIKKKGSTLPFVRVYNDVHSIHMVLFAEYGRTVERVETALIASEQFRLPGKKALVDSGTVYSILVLDASKVPCERTNKNNAAGTAARKSVTR